MAIPKPKVFWPLQVVNSNRVIPVRVGVTDYTANVAVGTYYRPVDLKDAVEAALFSGTGLNWTVTITADGFFHFSTNANTFEFRFDGAANAAHPWLGFTAANWVSSNSGAPWTLAAPRQHSNGWYSPVAVRSDSKPYFEEPNSSTAVAMGGQSKVVTEGELICRDVYFEWLPGPKTHVEDQAVVGGVTSPTAIENWWRLGRARFRYFPDATDENKFHDWFLDGTVIGEDGFRPRRLTDGKAKYAVGPWKMRRYIP